MITAAAFLALATSAYAQPFTFSGYTEYAVEAETVSAAVSGEFTITDSLTFSPAVFGTGTTDTFGLDHVELTVTYYAAENMDLYIRVESDEDLAYSETAVGVNFSF